jgi:thiol-disulfide isomerase/thioredoxin
MIKLINTLFLLFITMSGIAQTDSLSLAPYKRFPEVPPFTLLLHDSTLFTKEDLPGKKASFFILFSPDCDHCKHETEEIIRHIDQFKKIEIVMATPLPLEKVKEFYKHYDLARFKNIKVGRDINFMLPVFYGARSLPFLAFYNNKGKLIDVFEGSLPVEKVLEKFNE